MKHARQEGVKLIIIPKKNLDLLRHEGLDDEEKQYVDNFVRGASTFVDVMEAAVKGG